MKFSHWLLPATAAAILALISGNYANAATNDVNVYLNGNPIQFTDAKPAIINNRSMVPIRVISENLGYQVTWNASNKTAVITTQSKEIVLTLNKATAVVTGKVVQLDTPASIISNRTFVPLRFIAENFGCTVNYTNQDNMLKVYIKTGDGSAAATVTQPSQTQPTQVQNQLVTYNDPIHNFSFDYPKTWDKSLNKRVWQGNMEVLPDSNVYLIGGVTFILQGKDVSYPLFSISVLSPMTKDEFLNKYHSLSDLNSEKLNYITFDEKSKLAYLYNISNDCRFKDYNSYLSYMKNLPAIFFSEQEFNTLKRLSFDIPQVIKTFKISDQVPLK